MIKWLSEAEKKTEKIKKEKIGKDTYIILILAGILLFIIALPTKKEGVQNTKASEGGKEITQEQAAMEETGKEAGKIVEESGTEQYTEHLEAKLEKILSSMEGVGSVSVMITVSSTGEQIIEKDMPNSRSITTESDAEGGSRSVNDMTMEEKTIYTTDEQGNQIPYVVKKLEPDVEGVMVVAGGGGNAVVSKNITEAIQALFGIEAHKIKIIKMKS